MVFIVDLMACKSVEWNSCMAVEAMQDINSISAKCMLLRIIWYKGFCAVKLK